MVDNLDLREPMSSPSSPSGGASGGITSLQRSLSPTSEGEVRHRFRGNSFDRGGLRIDDPENAHDMGDEASDNTMHNFWHRAGWLVMLLMCQSTSSVILEHFDMLLRTHPVVIYFLTMLVGAGGNAGGQSTVLVVRKLALVAAQSCKRGGASPQNRLSMRRIVTAEISVGARLALVLFVAAFFRCQAFQVRGQECLAICLSMLVIVFNSTIIGAALPLLLHRLRIDPAHAGATIQVIMDISGVTLTCVVSCLVLGLPVFGGPLSARNATALHNITAATLAPKLLPIRLGSDQDLNSFGDHSAALHPDLAALGLEGS